MVYIIERDLKKEQKGESQDSIEDPHHPRPSWTSRGSTLPSFLFTDSRVVTEGNTRGLLGNWMI